MIAASFFAKDLLLDWHEGERYFATQLTDYSPMQNSGGWQWTVGNGTDAAPYFRIFNPWTQQKDHDKECEYIKKWVPELKHVPNDDIHLWFKKYKEYHAKGVDYPSPIVNHDDARKNTLETYNKYFKA